MSRKEQLILDIQNLLNSYKGIEKTSINPELLQFLDENTLLSIIDSLLTQKESSKESDLEWLEKFKKHKA
ncbi:MAG: hypothetical protein WCY51_04455 [Sulfurimonas sp.]|uniref:hypothetical protein n=1 Tax=Sulfurimonas sp. TaxID=2022749 RepID=UPI0025E569F8|nr:hypothetical protein [Sulfurimonas sp.]MCK9453548.1 hypothetical protein [Sulfurimonas sp.]